MRAIVFDHSLSFQPRYHEPREIDGDTLLRVRASGISQTDIDLTRGQSKFTGVPGHEFVATVEQSLDGDLVGQRVVGETSIVCKRCDLCLSGLSSHCRSRAVAGSAHHDGAFADFLRLPAENLHVIPKSIDDDQAIFIETLASAFQVLKQIKLDGRKWVTVLGDGRLGLLVAQVLRNAGCPVRVIGKHPAKMALCEKWQIRSRGVSDITPRHDQDVVVDCTGSASGMALAMQIVRPRGTIVLKTTASGATGENCADLSPLARDEINVIGSRSGSFREAIRSLEEKQVDVVSLIHRRMKLEQGIEAMALAEKPGVLKVILTMT